MYSIASYADDNTPFFVGGDMDDIKSKLKNAQEALLQWLSHSQSRTDTGKCQPIIIWKIIKTLAAVLLKIWQCVLFDNKLTLLLPIDSIWDKISLKLNLISRITSYMGFNIKRLAVKAFFSSNFNYCSFVMGQTMIK